MQPLCWCCICQSNCQAAVSCADTIYPVLTPCALQIVVSFGNDTIGQHETSFPSDKHVPLPGPESTYLAQGPNISAFDGQLDGVCGLVRMTVHRSCCASSPAG